MSALNQNIGYNQPTNTGYYLGSDVENDADAWAEASLVQNRGFDTGITGIASPKNPTGRMYDLSGRQVSSSQSADRRLSPGIYIRDGKKIIVK